MGYILASKSPRRHAYLTEMGIPYTVLTAETDETLAAGVHPREGVVILAERKARAVADLACAGETVIAADTLVELDGKPLGKPRDEAEAAEMLRALSGKAHRVHTGVAVWRQGRLLSAVDTTAVHFRPLSDEEIREYIASGEPLDKAGAYGIQGLASAFVSKIEGNFDTVVGLPCALLQEMLSEIEP